MRAIHAILPLLAQGSTSADAAPQTLRRVQFRRDARRLPAVVPTRRAQKPRFTVRHWPATR